MKEFAYKWFFKAVSNPARLSIIRELRKGPRTVTALSRGLRLEQSLVSHNLRCLTTCGFVTVRPNGKERIYALESKTVLPMLRAVDKHINKYYERLCDCCDEVKKVAMRE